MVEERRSPLYLFFFFPWSRMYGAGGLTAHAGLVMLGSYANPTRGAVACCPFQSPPRAPPSLLHPGRSGGVGEAGEPIKVTQRREGRVRGQLRVYPSRVSLRGPVTPVFHMCVPVSPVMHVSVSQRSVHVFQCETLCMQMRHHIYARLCMYSV